VTIIQLLNLKKGGIGMGKMMGMKKVNMEKNST
jgi:hypothetical protein